MWLPGDRIYETEADLESAAVSIAKRGGWLTRKFRHAGRRSAPDRWFAKGGYIFWIEFKRQLCEPTKLQWDEINEMREAGLDVLYVDAIEDFRAILSDRENLIRSNQ